jgi:hypothetical protein
MPIPADLIPGSPQLIAAGGVEPPRVIDFLNHAFPPPWSVPIDVVDVQTVNAGTSALINIVNTGVNKAVLRWFGNESTIPAGYADLRWTILRNGIAIEPYNLMRESRGLVSDPDPVMILLGQGQLIQVRVDNLGIGNLEAKTRLKGWVF